MSSPIKQPTRPGISAVITSKKRKVQLGFDDDVLTEDRASSANQVPQGTSRVSSSQGTRPSTHEGLTPAPPTDKNKRTFRTVSPRHVSIKFLEHDDDLDSFEKLSPIKPPTVTITTNLERALAAAAVQPSHGIAMDDSVSSPTKSKSMPSEYQLPSFIKSTKTTSQLPSQAYGDSQSQQKLIIGDASMASMSLFSTQYPSLGHRLKANMGVDSIYQASPTKPPTTVISQRRYTPRGTADNSFKVSNWARKTQIERKLRGDASVSSQMFDCMDIEDMLAYLIDARDEQGNKVEFLHVTSRYHVERVTRTNFYDLVILERPGYPGSGYVWSRDHKKYRTHTHDVLPPHHVMQLSLQGLLVTSEDERIEPSELIFIQEFIMEKEQLEFLRSGRFFGLFKELKAFRAWKLYTQHSYVSRMKRILQKQTFFSDQELIQCIQYISETTYTLEIETDLFHFHGPGSMLISDFFTTQIQKLQDMSNTIQSQIELLGEKIAAQYHAYISSRKLEEMIQDVKDHHPLRTFMHTTETTTSNFFQTTGAFSPSAMDNTHTTGYDSPQSIDWVKFRSMQRLSDNFKQKIMQILYMAQFRMEYKIACIVEKFWLRMKQYFLGIYQLKTNRRVVNIEQQYQWEIDRSLFDAQGNLVLNENNDPYYQQLLHPKKKAASIVDQKSEEEVANKDEEEKFLAAVAVDEEDQDEVAIQKRVLLIEQQNKHKQYLKEIRELHSNDKVTADWQQQGSHLSIQVSLHVGEELRKMELEDLFGLSSNVIDQVKVVITPTKHDVLNHMHMLCGAMGKLLESLPNLKFHPLICSEETRHLYKRREAYGAKPEAQLDFTGVLEADEDQARVGMAEVVQALQKSMDDQDMEATSRANTAKATSKKKTIMSSHRHDNHQSSSNYFTFLIMSPVYNCRNSYQLAIDCIRYLFQSYQQASNVDSYRLKLLEIVRKLWALSPQTLIKQIERSFALTKIRDYVDNPELVEDLRRSQQRDRGRLSSYKTSLDYVDKLMEAQLYHFLDLKHSMGFVTSFQPVVKQLTMYKIIQENNLHIKLPHAFVTRCSLVYDFIRKLENSVESQQHLTNTTAASAVVSPRNMKGNNQNAPAPVDVMTYQQLLVCIQLMRRMKHFEEIKPYFDSEVDMIESMFQIMVEHQSKKAGKQQQTRSNTQNKTSSTVAELTSIDDRRERDYIMLEMQVEQGMTRYTHTQRYKSDMRGSLHKSAEAEAALQYSALPPEKLFKVFLEAIERLSITTSKTKSAILSLLHDMKRYILIHRQELHIQIQKVRGTLEDFQIVLPSYLAIEIKASTKKLQQKQLLEPTDQTPDLNGKPEKDEDEDDADDEKEIPGVRSVAEITQFINMTGKEVEKLRKASNECIAAQVILMEAHDIVGAANPILMSSEVSHFQDMDALEQEYSYRCEVWKVITEAEVIRRQLYSNKLGNPQAIVELNTSFLKILNKYNWLLLHIADPPETDSEVVLLEETVSAADELASITGAVVEVKEKKLPYSVLLLEPMKVIIEDVMPKMESAAYLSSKHLKGRHWQFLNIHSFLPSEMLLKFSGRQNEFISVIDIANTNNMIGNPSPASPTSTDIVDSLIGGGGGGGGLGLGNIHRLVLKELFSRHLHFYLQPMQYITSEAIMESVLESTLDSIEQTMRLSCIQTSTLWLRDSKLREKLFSEVNEIVNIIPLRVMVRYCWKAVCMVETTSQDMLLTAFDKRIERVKDFIYKVDYFLENYREIQYRWYYILVVIKFLPRNDIDRDMIRIYNNVTEDMKKVEVQLLQKNGNLYNTFASSLLTTPIAKQVNSNNKNGVVDTQEENTAAAGNSSGISSGASYDVMNTETMKLNLHYILEDVHSIIQSLLDACPRLSMLTYNKLMLLYRVWLFGPYVELAFVSECLHDMFPGVGLLHTVLLHGQKQYVCDGFESYHRLEMVRFLEVIPLTLPLEDFVTTFETSLRKVLEKSCDIMVVHRINCIKAMISDQQNDVIVQHLQSLFQIRINHLHALISNDHVNQCYQLTNMVSFAEDIWTCLGHPTGCLTMAKPDLLIENHLFLPRWRTSLQLFIDNCQENLVFLQDLMTSLQQVQDTSASSSSSPKKGLFYNGQDFDNLFSRAVTKNKAKQIISNFLLQEIHFMKIAHELLQCSCVESATEFWAGKFQIRFEYIKEHRYNYSPIDITLGNISLPYGMEYIEGGNVIVYSKELEYALGRVLSSAFALRGSTFIQKASNSSASEKGSTLTDALLIGTEGELMITCKDIALALGRISTTLSTASHSTNIRFFFSQLIYLDAIGGIDFTTISQDDLQLFIQIAQQFWLAIENKNDQFIQDSLKFPIKTKFTRNEVQSERRKQNLQQLRSTIMLKKERNIYFGFMFIGFASESEFTSMHVFDQFYRSIFDSISIDHAHSMQNLGIMLTSKGFMFGLDLEETLTRSMQLLVKYLESTSNTSPLAELKSDARNQAQSWLKRIVTAKELAIVTHLSSISLSLYPLTKFAMASSQQASASGQFPTGSSSASSHQSYSHRKIMRFYIELICFCGNLWDRLLHLSVGYVQQSTVRLIQQHFFTEFSNKLLQLLPKDEVEQFAQQFQQDIPLIQTGVANLLRKVATQHGYICNHDFLATCASLWESLIEQQSPFFILHGELSTGKSAVCEVVSKAMNIWRYRQRKQALQVMRRQVKGSSNPSSMAASRGGDLLGEYEYEHSLDHYNNSIVYGTVSNPVLCRIAAKKIFIFFYNWWKLKAKISEIQLLEESQRNLYMMTSDAPDTATSTKAAANTLSQSQTSDVGDGISRAATMDVDDNNKLASADVKNNGVTPTRGKHIAEIIPEAVSKSAGETPIIATPANEEQFVQLSSSKREKLEINAINACLKTTMIYHASMSVDALIGCFDVQGKWNDGILIRKLRHVHELAYNQKIKDRNQALDQKNFMFPSMQKSNQKSAEKNVGTSFHVIVFNGPMTYHIEQLLHGVYFQSMNATTSLSWIHSRFDHLTFPTGESHSIPKNVKILIETSDIHHASPACLAIIPSQSLRFTHEECRKRILTLWIRSLTHWLGDFPPWLDFIEGVHKLLLHTSFIEDLLYEDLNATTVSIAIITSKVTSFLKILEELLIQIHEMAIQQATFSIPEDREIPESESEEDEEEHEDRMGEGYLSDSEKQKHQTMPTSGTPQKNTSTLKRGIYKLRGIMSLHAKGREQLVKRGKLSIVYAALWGLGGVCNSSEKRKFFESMLRDLTQQYFDDENEESGQQSKVGKGHPQVVFPGGGISIPTEVSVYECTLSLEDCCFLPAYEYDLRSKTILHNLGLPEKYREHHIYCELLTNPKSKHDQLQFRSMNTRAVDAAIRLLLSAGSNVMLFGVKNCGKSKLIKTILGQLGSHCPTPDEMRQQIMTSLIHIINGTSKPEGIFRALEMLKSVLHRSTDAKLKSEFGDEFNRYWRHLASDLEVSL